MTEHRPARTWPLLLLALPAFVAIWSGWVGLGARTGFGVVQPFPGIAVLDRVTLNTAITLPIGVETYAAYALRVWLAGAANDTARRFARLSAIGALVLGSLGQVAYHLMVAAGIDHAPWQITTLVSCLPVAVLGMGVALAHLQNAPSTPARDVQQSAPGPAHLAEVVQLVDDAHRAAAAVSRPPAVTLPVPEQIEAPPAPLTRRDQARELYAQGMKKAEIARRLGVAPQTVQGYLPKTT